MSVTAAIRFPLGRYHATPWDRSVNEGAVEWPPSPWRLLRALVATWYTRWPELPAPALDELLNALAAPPSYRTPPARPAHSRHYLPDPDHRKGETGNTDLTLDPYLSVPADQDLLVRWDTTLSDEQRATLAKLLELMPYLGRADSVCTARLCEPEPAPDHTWWQPATAAPRAGADTTRLLTPTLPVRRAVLELTTVDVRKARRTIPPDTTWLTYTRTPAPPATPPTPPPQRTPDITAIRFAILSPTPLAATHGVLLADEVHRQVARKLNGISTFLLGTGGAATNHEHAHWVPISNGSDPNVHGLVVWAPRGITTDEVARIITVRRASGRRRQRDGEQAYQLKGLPDVELRLQAVGTVHQVAPELCGPARRWTSLTPYLPVRHRKRESLDDHLATDVARELTYRRQPASVTVTRINPDETELDRWAQRFRRYRTTERLTKARPGYRLQLQFTDDVRGPLLLGHLSHFGFGIFVPQNPA